VLGLPPPRRDAGCRWEDREVVVLSDCE
jgi:hypothetical protein